jgi:hypothetical protein
MCPHTIIHKFDKQLLGAVDTLNKEQHRRLQPFSVSKVAAVAAAAVVVKTDISGDNCIYEQTELSKSKYQFSNKNETNLLELFV